jgi:hypothetical protein
VRLIAVPDGLEDDPDFPTKPIFAKCVVHDFVIAGLNDGGMAELGIESVTGRVGETIWVGPPLLEKLPT